MNMMIKTELTVQQSAKICKTLETSYVIGIEVNTLHFTRRLSHEFLV
jgi:hypothetical protein